MNDNYIEGTLTLSDEKPGERRHFQLKQHVLRSGHALIVLISGYWITGSVEFGSGTNWHGWYLATSTPEDPIILLSVGLSAMIRKE